MTNTEIVTNPNCRKIDERGQFVRMYDDTKRCNKCGVEKPVSEFYKGSKPSMRYRSLCKECNAEKFYRHNGMKCIMTESVDIKIKVCNKCKLEKSATDYGVNPRSKDGLQYTCKRCVCEIARKSRENRTPEEKKKVNERRLRNYHNNIDEERLFARCYHRGITKQQWLEIFRIQNGKCAICGVSHLELTRALAIDHNHLTEEIRGLLCVNCNSVLGHCKDNINILERAIEYLKKYEVEKCQPLRT